MIDGIEHPLVPDRPYWYAELGTHETLGTMYPCWYPRLVTGQFISPRLEGLMFADRTSCEDYIRNFLNAELRTPDERS